jgi:hypothetical protein
LANKEQLLEWVADAVLEQAPPMRTDLPWDDSLRVNALNFFDRVTAYPGLPGFLTNRSLTPGARRRYGQGDQLYRRAGLGPEEARKAQAAYHTLMFGLLAMEARFRPEKRQRGRGDEDAILLHTSPHEFVTYCLDLFIAGVRARVEATASK